MTAPPRKRRRSWRVAGIGCLSLIVLVFVCGAASSLSYRIGLQRGQESAAIVASRQAAELPQPTGSLCAPERPAPAGEQERTLSSGDAARRYLQYVPSGYDPARQAALVLSLHGSGSSAEEQRDYSQWNVFAEAHNFVVVYPEASPEINNTFVSFRLPDTPLEENLFDVAYIEDVLAQVQSELCIDPQRVYLNGFSAGGSMTLLLACRLPGVFAATGTVAAPFWSELNDPAWCPAGAVPPLIAFHGTADRVIPYDGGGPPVGLTYVKYEEWTAAWSERSGCEATHEAFAFASTVEGVRYTDCDAELLRYRIEGGGHAWPGGAPIMDLMLGPTTMDIVATEQMWDFFSRQGPPEPIAGG